MPIRRNLDDAKDYSRLVSRQSELITQNQVAPEDRILFIDRSEFYELAQPKQTSLSGLAQSVIDTPEFEQALNGSVKAHGAFFDTTKQEPASATSRNFMEFNSTSLAGGVTIASGNRIIVPNSGIYDIQFSAQLDTDGGTAANFDIWFVKNNTDVPWSNTKLHLDGTSHDELVAAWNFVASGEPGDNFQIGWAVDNTDAYLAVFSGLTNPVRPDVPSVILTVNQH